MNIVIAGGTGFIGSPLVERLTSQGHEVAVLSRRPERVSRGRGIAWDGRSQGAWSEAAAEADLVINLAGENIGDGRWTEARKQRLVSSRLDATNALVEAMQQRPGHRRTLINASGVNYYGNRGDELLDETAPQGEGFLAELVDRWETAARQAEPVARVVIFRFGVVLGPGGGALQKMALPFRLGVGGPVGSGRQWMSWIDREDVVRLVEWVIDNPQIAGTYNATAPEPVRNRDFARSLGRALRRPAVMPVPAFALKAMFGQMADEVLLGGQRVIPARAERDGFVFHSRTVDAALVRVS